MLLIPSVLLLLIKCAVVADIPHVVQFHQRPTTAAISDILRQISASQNLQYEWFNSTVFHAISIQLTQSEASNLKKHHIVAHVEFDCPTYAAAEITKGTNTQANPPNWGLIRINQRELNPFQDSFVYPSSAGQDVDVVLMDSGVDAKHPEFTDIPIQNLANLVKEEEFQDLAGHGTHVAGIICGANYGVAKRIKLHVIKVLNSEGKGNLSILINGLLKLLQFVESTANWEKKKVVVNMSLHTEKSSIVDQLVQQAFNKNVVIITSAANTGGDTCNISPGGSQAVLAVGATDRNDGIWSQSASGPCVSIFAPGVDIKSLSSNRIE